MWSANLKPGKTLISQFETIKEANGPLERACSVHSDQQMAPRLSKLSNVRESDPPRAKRRVLCARCGSERHTSKNPACCAWNTVCSRCGVKGHRAKMCEPWNDKVPRGEPLQSSKRTVWCWATVNGVKAAFLVDSGAEVSLLTASTWKSVSPRPVLEESPTSLRAYGGSPIAVVGLVRCDLVFETKMINCRFIVTDDDGANVLGADVLGALRAKVDCGARACVVMALEQRKQVPLLAQYSDLFNGKLGAIKKFVHTVTVRSSVQPKQQKLRRLPLPSGRK